MTKDRETLQPQVEHEISPKPSAERKPPEESAAAQVEAKAGGLLARLFGRKEKGEEKSEEERISEFNTALLDALDAWDRAADDLSEMEADASYFREHHALRSGKEVPGGTPGLEAANRSLKPLLDSMQRNVSRLETALDTASSLARQFSPDQKVAAMRLLQERGAGGLYKKLERRMSSIDELLNFLSGEKSFQRLNSNRYRSEGVMASY